MPTWRAAVLAGARELGTTSMAANMRRMLEANFPPGYLGTTLTRFVPSEQVDATGSQSLTLEAAVDLPSLVLPMARYIGGASKVLTVQATAERRARNTELAMVLDNTGSLAGQPIRDLRAAAQNLSNVLFNGQAQVPGLYVAIVPYTAEVNIGTQHVGWMRDLATRATAPRAWSDYLPTTWKGCVMAQPAPYDQTDDPLAVTGPLEPFFWASSAGDKNVWPQAGKVKETPANNNTGYGPNLGCGPPITPLTASRAVINQAIANLDAWNRGGTMANIGLIWGWRALSPSWRGVWRNADWTPIPATYPLNYETSFNSKVVVLMTDGKNEWHYNASGGFINDRTAYGSLTGNALGATASNASSIIDQRMLVACTALKRRGVIIFTITFGGVAQSVRNTLTACASPTDTPLFPGRKYFDAPTGAVLTEAFGSIGRQLTELRLVR